jgi:membrane protease YdiL (CAAX protease family)
LNIPLEKDDRRFASALRISVISAFIALAIELFISAIVRLNVRAYSQLWWFVIPAAIIGLYVYNLYECKTPLRQGSLRGAPAASISIGIGLAMGALSLYLTGWQNISIGTAELPGDEFSASFEFQAMASMTIGLLAAVVEESVIRGRLQFRLQDVIGMRGAEAVASVVFVLIHFALFANLVAMLHVVVMSVLNGRIAARGQRVAWPLIIHALANGSAIAAAMIARTT